MSCYLKTRLSLPGLPISDQNQWIFIEKICFIRNQSTQWEIPRCLFWCLKLLFLLLLDLEGIWFLVSWINLISKYVPLISLPWKVWKNQCQNLSWLSMMFPPLIWRGNLAVIEVKSQRPSHLAFRVALFAVLYACLLKFYRAL